LPARYNNIVFAEQFFDEFYPSKQTAPELHVGKSIDLPVIMIYKNGIKVDGQPGVRSRDDLEKMVNRNNY
jgi:hypothetical protein